VQALDVLQVPGKIIDCFVARVVLHRYKASMITFFFFFLQCNNWIKALAMQD